MHQKQYAGFEKTVKYDVPKERKNRGAEILLWGAVILLGVIFFIMFRSGLQKGNTVIVKVDGVTKKVCSLYEDTVFEVQGKNGGTNKIVIKSGKVQIQEASCPDKLCVHEHAISCGGQSIICLPNKVVVEIQLKEEQDADIIAR